MDSEPYTVLQDIGYAPGEVGTSGGTNTLFEANKKQIAGLTRSQMETCLERWDT